MSHNRKHIRAAMNTADFSYLPELLKGEVVIGRVNDMRGTHCEVSSPNPADPATLQTFLAMIPAKFRGMVWIKKGNFVAISMGDVPADSRFKLKGAVCHLFSQDQIDQLALDGHWPQVFASETKKKKAGEEKANNDEEEEEEEVDYFACGNPNRRPVFDDYDDDEDEDEEEDEDEDEYEEEEEEDEEEEEGEEDN